MEYRVSLYRRIVERYNTPSDRSTDRKIKKIGKEFLGEVVLNFVPRVDDVIQLDPEVYYKVKEVILNCVNNETEYIFTHICCEVVKYRDSVLCRNGSDVFEEPHCPVTSLEDFDFVD